MSAFFDSFYPLFCHYYNAQGSGVTSGKLSITWVDLAPDLAPETGSGRCISVDDTWHLVWHIEIGD